MQLGIVTFLASALVFLGGSAAVQAEEKAATGTTVTHTVQKPIPLHEHPTLVGLLQRNNQIRAQRGLAPLRMSPRLTQAAQHHAWYMARTGQFSHDANNGPQYRAQAAGFRGGVRENIAMGQSGINEVFSDWSNSSGHYTNLMSGSDLAGFGYAINSSGQGFWVAVYGNNDGVSE